MITLTEIIKNIYELKQALEAKNSEITKLKEEASVIQNQVDEMEAVLLNEMIDEKQNEIKVDNLVATYFAKNEFSYGDEKALLNYLIDKGMTDYITLKTSQSINKSALKKDLKANQELKESLKDFVGDRKVEYVVVTTEENHQRMLEHIEAGRAK